MTQDPRGKAASELWLKALGEAVDEADAVGGTLLASLLALQRIAELIETYADLPLGGTDASVVALAERLSQTNIATLDQRHFAVVRPAHADHFNLLPQ